MSADRKRAVLAWLAERWPILLFAVLALCVLVPALAQAHLFGGRYDWRYFDSMGEMSRRSWLWYGQVPLWNPYSCGGEVALANPQSLDLSPTFLLILLFGTALGYKLSIAVYYFCALDGAFRLGRRLGLSLQGSLLAGLGYGLSGWLALHFSTGHMTFVGVALYPYLLLCFDRAVDEWEWVVPGGLVAAWIVAHGGTFTPPMAALLLGLWGVLKAVERRSLRPFLLLAATAAVALVVGAARMLPLFEFVHDHPRPSYMRAPDTSPPWLVLFDLIAWREYGALGARKYYAHEYAARLPYALLPLWAAGLFWLAWSRRLDEGRRRVARQLWVVAVVGALLAMGNLDLRLGKVVVPISPWSLLQRLPVLKDLRVPSRHLILVALGLALLAGLVWDQASDWLARRHGEASRGRWRRLGWILVALAAVDGAVYSALQFRGVFTDQVPIPRRARFYHAEGTWASMRDFLFSGRGSLGCDEEAPLQRAEALDPGDLPQERLLDPDAGEVVESRFSPARRIVTVELRRGTTLLVNSNWNEHWKAGLGEGMSPSLPVVKLAGRLAVDLGKLAPGRHVVTLRYRPRSFDVGLLVTAVGLPLLLGVFFVVRRRRGKAGQ